MSEQVVRSDLGPAQFFDCVEDNEELIHSDPEDAVESHLDSYLSPKCDVLATLRKEVGETITVYGFAQEPVDENCSALDVDLLLESVLQSLDEEYGNPNEMTDPTPKMREAAEALVAAIRGEYVPWRCALVSREEVNVEAWVRENRPDWLEEIP